MGNYFSNLTNDELKAINEDRIKNKEEGLRPRSFDNFILMVMSNYPLIFAEGWNYVEKDFYEEVCSRFFKDGY